MSLDSLIGFPPSRVSTTANSLAFSCMIRAIRKIYFPLSLPESLLQVVSYAFRAAFTAKSTSFLFPFAMEASFSSVAGLIVSKYLPELGFTHFPPINKSYLFFNFTWLVLSKEGAKSQLLFKFSLVSFLDIIL